MRKLVTRDILSFCRCLKALGAREKLQAMAKKADNASDLWDTGFDLVWDLFDAATEREGEAAIYQFLAGPFELEPEQVAGLPFPELAAMLKQLAEENDLAGFFKSAGALMKSS